MKQVQSASFHNGRAESVRYSVDVGEGVRYSTRRMNCMALIPISPLHFRRGKKWPSAAGGRERKDTFFRSGQKSVRAPSLELRFLGTARWVLRVSAAPENHVNDLLRL